MRTVLYARFSSTLQNSRSIEDQVALLRERCERESWEVVDVFTDYAISGAAGICLSRIWFKGMELARRAAGWPPRSSWQQGVRAGIGRNDRRHRGTLLPQLRIAC